MMNNDIALLSTVAALVIGIGLVYICKRHLKVDSGSLLVAVLIAPVLFYLSLSGRLVEFKGIGVEARFQQTAAEPIVPLTVKPVAGSAAAIRETSGAKALLGMGSEVILLPVPTEEQPMSHQRVFDVALQIYPGLLQDNFELLVVIDQAGKVLGYFNRAFFFDLLRIEIEQTIRGARTQFDSARVVGQLEQTQLWDIVQYPEMRAESWGSHLFIPATDSNAEALTKLASANQDAAVVVNADGAYAGIVRRGDIVAELLMSLVDSDT